MRLAGEDAGAPGGGAFLKPSFVPASRETSRVMPAVLSPEPHLGWFSRGYLPHWDHPGMIQSVTFRLHDAMPREVVDRWRLELGLPLADTVSQPAWRRRTKTAGGDAGGVPTDPREIALWKRIARYEDAGWGACWLRDERIGQLVERALLCFDSLRYRLLAWCVMPNHVHVLIEAREGFPLSEVLHAWKSYTAHEANKLLRRQGEFWQREYRDRYIRHAEHFVAAIRYIENNPVKAGLVTRTADWPFSSARYRTPGAPPPGAPASSPASSSNTPHAGTDASAPGGGKVAGEDAGAPGASTPHSTPLHSPVTGQRSPVTHPSTK
jgi:REP element-mobilizing transposase RayT